MPSTTSTTTTTTTATHHPSRRRLKDVKKYYLILIPCLMSCLISPLNHVQAVDSNNGNVIGLTKIHHHHHPRPAQSKMIKNVDALITSFLQSSLNDTEFNVQLVDHHDHHYDEEEDEGVNSAKLNFHRRTRARSIPANKTAFGARLVTATVDHSSRSRSNSNSIEQRFNEENTDETTNSVSDKIDLLINFDEISSTEYLDTHNTSHGIKNMKSNSNYTGNDVHWYLTVLLAQQEARCLEDYGGSQAKADLILPDDLYIPFLCPTSSSSSKQLACEKASNGGHVSSSSSSWDCESRCKLIVKNITNELQTYYKPGQFNTSVNCAEFSRDGNCIRTSSNSVSVFKSSTFSNSTTFSDENNNNKSFIQSVDVFCEGVTPFSSESGESQTNHGRLKRQNIMNRKSGSGVNHRHFVLLKTLVQSEPAQIRPIVFVVEMRELLDNNQGWASWKTLGKTLYGFDEMEVSYFSKSYQWRVTAVNSDEIVDIKTTTPFKTLDGYVEPKPPKKIFASRHRIVNDSILDILISWEPPAERACFYKIVLENQDSDEKPRAIRIKDQPLGVHHYWFENLRFGSHYGVRMTSRTASWKHEDESTHAKLYFVTPTCLEAHHYRFDKCAPPPPRNLTSTLTSMSPSPLSPPEDEARDDELSRNSSTLRNLFSVQLSWLPPIHTAENNSIAQYVVDVIPFSLNLFHSQKYPVHQSNLSSSSSSSPSSPPHDLLVPAQKSTTVLGPFTLAGNVTEFKIDGLIEDTGYDVLVTALSIKGPSVPARLSLSTKIAVEPTVGSKNGSWIYVTVLLAVAIVAVSSCHLVRLFIHKRKVKAARTLYFKAMEERDDDNEWSIVPLNEQYSPLKMLHDNLPKEKWDVGCQNLKLGEIIGQGAFGVVRRAEMPRKKYFEFQQKYKNLHRLTTTLNVHDGGGGEDDEDMETVAVKMLKVSATMSDRDALIKEIVTMQNLGCHGQIVTLLGACTIGRSLCLVLEYCPGGDLLTFLRKVRQTYWPLLNMGAEMKENKSTSPSGSNRSGSIVSSQISYADLGSFSEDSPSSEEKNLTQSMILPEVFETKEDVDQSIEAEPVVKDPKETKTSTNKAVLSQTEILTEKCPPVTEKDILSYARQIALGMAYLERNRVVHRDLACRNVLVMGDYKQVKISDFGLSRDIYTWNVYHQKTNGKLPVKWMAIESIFSYCFTSKSDVWAYGIILWELVTLGGNPYPAIGNNELFHLLKSGYRMERPENCSEELYALMRKCWRGSPTDRPNFTELRHHLEAMIEASEPSMYLSLQADIPVDYSLNCRSDLPDVDRPGSTPSTASNNNNTHSVSTGVKEQDSIPYQNVDSCQVKIKTFSNPLGKSLPLKKEQQQQQQQRLNQIEGPSSCTNNYKPRQYNNNDTYQWNRMQRTRSKGGSTPSVVQKIMMKALHHHHGNIVSSSAHDASHANNHVHKVTKERSEEKEEETECFEISDNHSDRDCGGDHHPSNKMMIKMSPKKEDKSSHEEDYLVPVHLMGNGEKEDGGAEVKPGFLFPRQGSIENRAYDLP